MGIEIKEPCSEDWGKMTPTQKGAFCSACAKEVVDFTGMSSLEIKTQLAIYYRSGKNLCGRIETAQLAEINGDFYQWKSEKEHFNTVWIFSLIAVFGLTLFSCQNTLTKEIVSQMETNGAKIIEKGELKEDVFTEEKNEGIIPLEMNDQSVADNELNSVDIEISADSYIEIALERRVEIEFITCTEWIMGNIVSGFTRMPYDDEEEEESVFLKFLEAYLPTPIVPTPPKLEANPNPAVQLPNQNGILNVEGEDFEIAIHPLPIDASSRLFIDTQSLLTVEIALTHIEEDRTTYSGKKHLQIGKYSIDLKLSELPSGNYRLKVSATNTEKSLAFTVQLIEVSFLLMA